MRRPTLTSSSVRRRQRDRRKRLARAPGPPPRRFPKAPQWLPPVEPTPAPWELIREALARTQEDGLSLTQQAGAVYAILVGRGLMDGGHA
jgi:hypothetical protein